MSLSPAALRYLAASGYTANSSAPRQLSEPLSLSATLQQMALAALDTLPA